MANTTNCPAPDSPVTDRETDQHSLQPDSAPQSGETTAAKPRSWFAEIGRWRADLFK